MNKVLIGAGILVVGVVIGRATAPERVVTVKERKELEVEAVKTEERQERSRRAIVKIDPDGTKTVTFEDIAKSDSVAESNKIKSVENRDSKTVENRSKIRLEGFLVPGLGKAPILGLGASYRLLGPVSVGAGWMPGQPFLIVGVDF